MAEVVEAGEVRHCVNHPAVETVVSCGRCGKPICPRCMIFAPVGVRCRECAQLRRLPQYTLSPRLYARVMVGALGLALGLGFLLSFIPPAFGFISSLVGGIVVGMLAAEGLRRLSGYKQGRQIEIIGGATVVLSVLASNAFLVIRHQGLAQVGAAIQYAVAPPVLASSVLAILVGVYFAVQRLR